MARRRLHGLRIVVTGASGGIGQALARELAARGARLLLTARKAELLGGLAERLASAGTEVRQLAGDVTIDAVRRAIVDRAEAEFGGLDVLVNNAGVGAFGRFDEASPARLRQVMEIDFFAAAELTRSAIPLLRRGRTPAIVNIASILGHRAIPLAAEYCAAKFAIRGLSESLRAELARDGIDLLVVSPGTTDTPFFENVVEMRTRLPWRKDGVRHGATPESVARATVRALERGRSEIIPGLAGKLLVLANRLAPRVVDRWMRRYV